LVFINKSTKYLTSFEHRAKWLFVDQISFSFARGFLFLVMMQSYIENMLIAYMPLCLA